MDVPSNRWWHMPASLYAYTFRRWVVEEDPVGWQAQVVVIHSPHPLFPDDLLKRMLAMTPHAKEFLLIEQPSDSVIALDTWQRDVEAIVPSGDAPKAVRAYSHWWSYAECDVVEVGADAPMTSSGGG